MTTGDPVDERGRVVQRHAELRLGAAGVDGGVCLPGHGGVDADQDPLAAGPEPHEAVDVVCVVDDDQPDAGSERVADVAVALGVAVHQDSRRIEARGQRDRELARRRDVAAEPLLGEDAQDGRAGQRLRGEMHLAVGVAVTEGGDVLARRVAQPLLVEHERRRAELGGDVGQRAPADGQAAVAAARRGAWEDVEEAGSGHRSPV